MRRVKETPYICEAVFSAMISTKTKSWSILDISNTLRVSLSPSTPRWDRLVAEKQGQGLPLIQCYGELFLMNSMFVIMVYHMLKDSYVLLNFENSFYAGGIFLFCCIYTPYLMAGL